MGLQWDAYHLPTGYKGHPPWQPPQAPQPASRSRTSDAKPSAAASARRRRPSKMACNDAFGSLDGLKGTSSPETMVFPMKVRGVMGFSGVHFLLNQCRASNKMADLPVCIVYDSYMANWWDSSNMFTWQNIMRYGNIKQPQNRKLDTWKPIKRFLYHLYCSLLFITVLDALLFVN